MSTRAKHKPPAEDRDAPDGVDGRVSRARRLRESRRAQLLGTAARCFADNGYHRTSIDDIIKASGVARGTFYLYFESKRALFDALLDGFFVQLAATVRRVDTAVGAAPPIEQVQDNVRRIFAILDSERAIARILIREAVGLDEELDRKLGDFYGRVAGLIERALRSGQRMGLVRPLDPTLVAYMVLGTIKEVIDRAFVAEGGVPDLDAARRELVDFCLRAVFGLPATGE